MFRQVLVGVDDDHGGRDAIALAKLLAGRDGALTFGHIFHADTAVPWGFQDPTAPERAEEARQLLERVAGEAGVPAHLRWEGAPSVGRGLHELAEASDADLLVVGSSKHALLGRVRLADDTRAALNAAPCAIAIAPAGYSSDLPSVVREIGVGYDGSTESEHALALARTLAAELGSKLSAFQAVAVPRFGYSGLSTTRPAGVPIAEMLERARDSIAGLGGVEPHVAYGDAAEELTVYSASLDLLLVGSRSYGPVGRVIHGGIAEHLARTARCPLLVLPRGARTKSVEAESESSPDAVAAAG
ncbi:MAG TPA: universal stress protein [Solirubrobacteraceae bacterium]|nr:universal stress protein [Solirubrobacteraceae bacterium]